MANLEAARKHRMEVMESFRRDEELKKQILDVIVEVLDFRTKIREFSPIKIVFETRELRKNDDILICNHVILYHTYLNESKQRYIEKAFPDLQWYAKIIYEYLSRQDGLVVSGLFISGNDECSSFTVNFKE